MPAFDQCAPDLKFLKSLAIFKNKFLSSNDSYVARPLFQKYCELKSNSIGLLTQQIHTN